MLVTGVATACSAYCLIPPFSAVVHSPTSALRLRTNELNKLSISPRTRGPSFFLGENCLTLSTFCGVQSKDWASSMGTQPQGVWEDPDDGGDSDCEYDDGDEDGDGDGESEENDLDYESGRTKKGMLLLLWQLQLQLQILLLISPLRLAMKRNLLKMFTDEDLGFFANFLGIFIFVLVIAYHYVVADPKYEGNRNFFVQLSY